MASVPKVQLLLKDRLILEVPFAGDALRIGRMKENDLVVNNLAVSRFHAVLHQRGNGVYELEDLGSENGSEINGVRVDGTAPFGPGDPLTVGKHTLVVVPMATDEPVVTGEEAGVSDAWDSAQTYFAEGPGDLASAATEEPVAEATIEEEPMAPLGTGESLMPEELELLPVGLPEADLLAPNDENSGSVQVDALLDAAPAPADSPDPSGAFSFGEDEITAEAEVADDAGFSLLDDSLSGIAALNTTDPNLASVTAAPSGEHTALFDFGGDTDLAGEPETQVDQNDSTITGADTAARAVEVEEDEGLTTEWSPDADAADRARPEANLHAGWIVQRGGTLDGVVPWDNDRLVVGRSDSCEIVLRDTGVSRQHATFVRSASGYAVEDEGSVNGTRVNGERICGTRPLRVGDVVKIEDFELTFVLDHQPLGSEVKSPSPKPAPQGFDPRERTVLADAPVFVDLVEEAEEEDDKDLEMLGVAQGAATAFSVQEDSDAPVRVEIELSRDALPPALRLAMEEAGEESLRLPAEIRIRLR